MPRLLINISKGKPYLSVVKFTQQNYHPCKQHKAHVAFHGDTGSFAKRKNSATAKRERQNPKMDQDGDRKIYVYKYYIQILVTVGEVVV